MNKYVSDLKLYFNNKFLFFNKLENIFYLLVICSVFFSSRFLNDNWEVTLAGLFCLIYTIFSGKGKIYCYVFGIAGTLLNGYISLNLNLFGYAMLHFLYYFPMEIWGYFSWKKNLKKNTDEIIKERLTVKGLIFLSFISILLSLCLFNVLKYYNDSYPLLDAFIFILSMVGMLLCVKRCIEQWIIWTIVNFLTIILWFFVYINGEKTFAILFCRIIYFVLGIYFYIVWQKNMKNEKINS